jgi:hypothetical protein
MHPCTPAPLHHLFPHSNPTPLPPPAPLPLPLPLPLSLPLPLPYRAPSPVHSCPLARPHRTPRPVTDSPYTPDLPYTPDTPDTVLNPLFSALSSALSFFHSLLTGHLTSPCVMGPRYHPPHTRAHRQFNHSHVKAADPQLAQAILQDAQGYGFPLDSLVP